MAASRRSERSCSRRERISENRTGRSGTVVGVGLGLEGDRSATVFFEGCEHLFEVVEGAERGLRRGVEFADVFFIESVGSGVTPIGLCFLPLAEEFLGESGDSGLGAMNAHEVWVGEEGSVERGESGSGFEGGAGWGDVDESV